jgi:uncharacterized repeat protein (TIGR03803 family)
LTGDDSGIMMLLAPVGHSTLIRHSREVSMRFRLSSLLSLIFLGIVNLTAQNNVPVPYSIVYNFTGGADGGWPFSGLIADSAGNLYGTTNVGGNTSSSCHLGNGCGLVFKIDSSGNQSVVYTFTGGADGSNPHAALIRDQDGNLYGTTTGGGKNASSCPLTTGGCGVVFKIDSSGKETVLYSFAGGSDGADPVAPLVRDAAGNLYGTTLSGGSPGGICGSYGCGVIFKVDTSGNETLLHTFQGGADGSHPAGGVLRDSAGNLYGMSEGGGKSSFCVGGCGFIFKLDPSGNETILYSFNGPDGALPIGELTRDDAGNFYGTTELGGNVSTLCGLGCGVVFKLDTLGNESVLYAFSGDLDGAAPQTGVIRDPGGNLYGTTYYGRNLTGGCRSLGCGVVFRLDPAGSETVLHVFHKSDGNQLYNGLVRHNGSLYGTTYTGGPLGFGVVYKVH